MAIVMYLGAMKGGLSPPVSHEWTELLTFELNMAERRDPGMSSSSAGLKVNTAIATKVADRASARLMQLHVAGHRLPLCLVNFTRAEAPNSVAAGGFTLHDVFVREFRTIRYSPVPKPVDEFVLGFERITLGHQSARNLSSMEAEALSRTWKISAMN